jgi:hypothetical protein
MKDKEEFSSPGLFTALYNMLSFLEEPSFPRKRVPLSLQFKITYEIKKTTTICQLLYEN